MTPEERKGLEEILAECGPAGPGVAWLKRQLEADDYDKTLDKMGGGKKARDARLRPIFDAMCAATAFDMHMQLMHDGRERGLWVWLFDNSKARAAAYDRWAEDALSLFCTFAGIEDGTVEKLRMSSAMREFKHISNSEIDDAALLEWDEVQRLYDAIGKELEKRCPPKKTKKTKTVTKKSISAKRARGGSTANR